MTSPAHLHVLTYAYWGGPWGVRAGERAEGIALTPIGVELTGGRGVRNALVLALVWGVGDLGVGRAPRPATPTPTTATTNNSQAHPPRGLSHYFRVPHMFDRV